MQSNYPAAILANFDGDYRAAYERLAKAYRGLEQQYINSVTSRFVEISRFEPDSEICIRKITEQEISRAVDMADCDDPGVMRKWLYVDDVGDLQPVTIGRREPMNTSEEAPLYYASSAIVAAGKCVGEITHTDH